jgi:hypothetical protein
MPVLLVVMLFIASRPLDRTRSATFGIALCSSTVTGTWRESVNDWQSREARKLIATRRQSRRRAKRMTKYVD